MEWRCCNECVVQVMLPSTLLRHHLGPLICSACRTGLRLSRLWWGVPARNAMQKTRGESKRREQSLSRSTKYFSRVTQLSRSYAAGKEGGKWPQKDLQRLLSAHGPHAHLYQATPTTRRSIIVISTSTAPTIARQRFATATGNLHFLRSSAIHHPALLVRAAAGLIADRQLRSALRTFPSRARLQSHHAQGAADPACSF